MQSHLNISFQKLWNYFLITILWQDPVNISAQWKLVLYRSILQSVKKLLKEIMTFIFSPLNNIIQGFFFVSWESLFHCLPLCQLPYKD